MHGLTIELADGSDFVDLTGAIHPTLVEGVFLATERVSGARVGSLAGVTAAPIVMRDLSAVPDLEGALFAGTTGYLRQSEGRCLVTSYDTGFAVISGTVWGSTRPDSTCRLTQSDVGQLTSVSIGRFGTGEVVQVRGLGGGSLSETAVAASLVMVDDIYAFHDEATATTLVAYRIGEQLVYQRHRGGPPQAFRYDGAITAMSAAVDRLNGGMLILFEERGAGWRIQRLPWEAGTDPRALTSLTGILADPIGPLVSNETEALIPLADGSMAYIPLALSELRILGPVDGGAVEDMIIVLRPDDSGGGLLFTQRSAGGEVLRFQSLSCNR